VDRRTPALLTLAVALLLAGCGGSDDPDSASSPSADGSSASVAPRPDATATDDDGDADPADGSALAGEWETTADKIFSANTANLPTSGITCTGAVRLTLAVSGDLTYTVRARCRLMGRAGTGRLTSTATWAAVGDELRITNSRSEGTITLEGGGVSVPMPTVFTNGTATYAISGDRLRIDFSHEAVGSVTHEFTRS
jgi:hypothetical protein